MRSEKATDLRQTKIEGFENVYQFIPTDSLVKGFYLIDYKTNGESPDGNWNSIMIK